MKMPKIVYPVWMISEEDIIEFQKIYRQRYGKDISHEDALDQAQKLLRFFEVIREQMKKMATPEIIEQVQEMENEIERKDNKEAHGPSC